MEVWAPSRVTEIAAARLAKAIASSRDLPSARATTSAPLKVSPAAVASTASTLQAGKYWLPCFQASQAPLSPNFKITRLGPNLSTHCATSGASSSEMLLPLQPSIASASLSLGVIISILFSNEELKERAGAGSKTVIMGPARPRVAAASTVSRGDSSGDQR